MQSKAAYLLFYRRRTQAQADPPDLTQRLLQQQAQYLARKEAEAKAAADAATAAAAAADVQPMDTADGALAADVPCLSPPGSTSCLFGICSPPLPSPPAMLLTAPGAQRPDDSSSTTTDAPAGAGEDADSSETSSSRPRGGRQHAAEAAGAADAVDSWGPLQHAAGRTPPSARAPRQSDQDVGGGVADMEADRDVL